MLQSRNNAGYKRVRYETRGIGALFAMPRRCALKKIYASRVRAEINLRIQRVELDRVVAKAPAAGAPGPL